MNYELLLIHSIQTAFPVHRENIIWLRFDDITNSWIPELENLEENFELPESDSIIESVQVLLEEFKHNTKNVYGYVLGVVYCVGVTGIPYLTGRTERRISF